MVDHGWPLRFGLFLPPEAGAPLVEIAQEADRYGLDLIGIQDQPYLHDHVDMLAVMGTVLAVTRRVRVFPAVACLPLRPPAALAKTMAGLDVLSGGRVELGLGAGGSPDGIASYGGPRLRTGEAREALAEAVQIIRMLWSGQHGLDHDRGQYRLEGAVPGPVPAHPIGIWLGVSGPRSLEVAGRIADGWVGTTRFVPPHRLAAALRRLDEAALQAERHPAELRRIYQLHGRIDESGSRGFLYGPVEQWVEEMSMLALGYGIDSFLYAGDPDRLGTFALEIVPAVRERVARERAASARGRRPVLQ
ncbi:LLM class flavin-dependent oxidoreductase [Actinomadura macrotermitis]|uniref:F420-dependent glucose-6-phosphate dehydrogenase n=1 Tax=Actinomadura macrotermitis TaxID=2585200 RepID=A0A7K0BST6_9ACTN|nr:LLM class flavin-dependent oxidoreductase [Actinomadura macrotermitis]MQY04253.1 F420-dependent glucose-6-phosphate dehydrogenase [Actinomadura macrotermitis]